MQAVEDPKFKEYQTLLTGDESFGRVPSGGTFRRLPDGSVQIQRPAPESRRESEIATVKFRSTGGIQANVTFSGGDIRTQRNDEYLYTESGLPDRESKEKIITRQTQQGIAKEVSITNTEYTGGVKTYEYANKTMPSGSTERSEIRYNMQGQITSKSGSSYKILAGTLYRETNSDSESWERNSDGTYRFQKEHIFSLSGPNSTAAESLYTNTTGQADAQFNILTSDESFTSSDYTSATHRERLPDGSYSAKEKGTFNDGGYDELDMIENDKNVRISGTITHHPKEGPVTRSEFKDGKWVDIKDGKAMNSTPVSAPVLAATQPVAQPAAFICGPLKPN